MATLRFAATVIWLWGNQPEPPRKIKEIFQQEWAQWASIFVIMYAFVETDPKHALMYTAALWAIKQILSQDKESYYYHEMYKVGERAVENRT